MTRRRQLVSTKKKVLIFFFIEGTKYTAKEGMTWLEWVNSGYNVDNYSCSATDDTVESIKGKVVCKPPMMMVYGMYVIQAYENYIYYTIGSEN